ncbi:leukemia inhibitory factor receptor isoform X3 [Salvelinus alpinus]|uniref:leukemia inhibitory factor receptor isoform X3 n=1 Tax=Salvelinus alpinus TaxID=8036 RepID=UPI0039FBF472
MHCVISWFIHVLMFLLTSSVYLNGSCLESGAQDTVDRVWKKTKMFPYQQVLKEGSTILFCCVPPRGIHVTNMTFNSTTSYPLINITHRVTAIAVHNLNITQASGSGVYSWCEDTTEKRNTYCSNFISFSPQRPENLSCRTEDLRTVICTWNPGRPANLYEPYKRTHTLHIKNTGEDPIKCDEWSCRFQAVPGLEWYHVSVVVRNQLGEEKQSYSFNITDRVFPVPEGVKVSPGVTEANVSWVVRGNLSGVELFCQVTADPVEPRRPTRPAEAADLQSTSMHQVCNGGLDERCDVSLEQLSPNTRYATRARCAVRGNLEGEWTQPTHFTTYPLVRLDVWRRVRLLSHGQRNVTLLWTPQLSGSASSVKIQGYKVRWRQEGSQWILWRDREQTQTEISIGPGQCDMIIQAIIQPGSSPPGHITIPPVERIEYLRNATRVSGSASGGFHLIWKEQEAVTCGYTVEWCTVGSGVSCTLQWRRVPVGNTSVSLPAGDFKAGHRYTFDIYGCTDEGDKLLGIRTGYSQELKPVQSPRLVEPIRTTSSSVTLEWRYHEDDHSHPGFITGYLVTMHKTGSQRSPGHVPSHFTKTVADPHNKSLTIVGLQEHQKYTFHLSALTNVGPGPQTTVTVKTQTIPSILLAKILTPLLLLLGLAILLCLFWKMLRSCIVELFGYPAGMNIKPIELDRHLHETSERLRCLKVGDCVCSDIEILSVRPNMSERTPLIHPKLPHLSSSSPTIPSSSFCPVHPSSYSSSMSSSLPSLSPSCSSSSTQHLHQKGYCPQSPTEVWDSSVQTSLTNRSFFPSVGAEQSIELKPIRVTDSSDISSSPIKLSNLITSEPSEGPQLQPGALLEKIDGYITTDSLVKSMTAYMNGQSH